MNNDVLVLALPPDTKARIVRAMVKQCRTHPHPDGHMQPRIAAFTEDLRARLPDHTLDVRSDHVEVRVGLTDAGYEAVRTIVELAGRHGLVVYDIHGDEVIGRPRRAFAEWPLAVLLLVSILAVAGGITIAQPLLGENVGLVAGMAVGIAVWLGAYDRVKRFTE